MNYTYLSDKPDVAKRESNYRVEEGVLTDDTDSYDPYSRAAVEQHWPIDFRGGGPDPSVDTSTVTVRYKGAA